MNGKRHGVGTYVWPGEPEGDRYVGYWKENLAHGPGELFYSDGSKLEGYWEKDKKEGQFTFTNSEGDRVLEEWKDDQFVE